MFMARASERLTADAYTCASVEAYLRAVAEERTRLELAIAEQQRRRDSADRFLERLDTVGSVPSVATPTGRPSTPSVPDGGAGSAASRAARPTGPACHRPCRWVPMSDAGAELVQGPVGTGGADDVLPGEVVRTLFDRNEQVLDALRIELDEATADADAAESRVRAHPALGLLAADEVKVLVPPDRTPVATGPVSTDPPRTTVDRRPSRSAPPVGPAVPGPAPVGVVTDEPSGVTRLLTSHWIWKVGVAVVVVALLLLKFG